MGLKVIEGLKSTPSAGVAQAGRSSQKAWGTLSWWTHRKIDGSYMQGQIVLLSQRDTRVLLNGSLYLCAIWLNGGG